MSEKTIEEIESDFKLQLYDYLKKIKKYDPVAQHLSSEYIDQIVFFIKWLIHFAKGSKSEFQDFKTTIINYLKKIEKVIQDHETRISNLEPE